MSAAALLCPAPNTAATRRAYSLPRLSDIPIPERVQVEPSFWGVQMMEMADFIGAYHTLLIHDRFGGHKIYVPMSESKSPVRGILGHNLSHVFTDIYGGQHLEIASARRVLDRARRAGLLAAVRAGHITGQDAAAVIGIARTHVSYLINHTNEGEGVKPIVLPMARETALLLNAARVVGEALAEIGLAARFTGLTDRIVGLGDKDSEALREALAPAPDNMAPPA
jgi:hypothetical protein